MCVCVCVCIQIVKVTGDAAVAAGVISPALTAGAVDLLQNNLNLQEHTLWSSLGPYWTQPRPALRGPVPPYAPVFLDGWKLPESEAEGWVDPVESQHKKDVEKQKQEVKEQTEHLLLLIYSYSNLSLSQVMESSKRWWKCRNRFNEVGFVPFNILEPVSHIEITCLSLSLSLSLSFFSLFLSLSFSLSAMQVNDELLKRLTNGKAALSKPLVIHRLADTSVPLDYHSPPAEVEAWLQPPPRVLTGAQLFSLNKEELRAVIPEEGARVYSQLTVQKSLLE
uniref:Uncharacterized protein n=1 Tax=Astyanax mexicanus TaxID=7994 RepID=A0A8B9JKR6_ASTMX